MMTFVKFSNEKTLLSVDAKEEDNQACIQDYKEALWIEVFKPTLVERAFILEQENIDLPEHHELHQIEYSNQFYHENDSLFLTANLVTIAYPAPENHAVTLIVSKNKIITVRYSDPNPVRFFLEKMVAKKNIVHTHYELLNMLLQYFVGKNADILEGVGERTNLLGITLSARLMQGSFKKIDNQGTTNDGGMFDEDPTDDPFWATAIRTWTSNFSAQPAGPALPGRRVSGAHAAPHRGAGGPGRERGGQGGGDNT